MSFAPAVPSLPWRSRLLTTWIRRGWRGSGKLAGWLGVDGTMPVRTARGAVFALQPFSYIDQTVIRSGYYESEVFAALEPHLGSGAVLWDIGANFGLHGVTAKTLSPATTVVGFEPAPATHARLVQNAALNRADLRFVAVALSDRSGYAPLHLAPAGNSGMTTLSPWSGGGYTGTVLVATARGDDLIASGSLPAPTVIKIDVEGHELPALTGLASTLRSTTCRVVVFEDATEETTPVKSFLRTAGFSVMPLERREQTEHALGNFIAHK